ncbi:Z1 domain-containing protein [Glutamicibacter sp. AOP38-B1-38]|uniref:Z1 domain-containing protein n=1 Tax=Glutamicibacter sp. AOP38-B1-38 TaxID=3457680 RepID=UPI0040342D3D
MKDDQLFAVQAALDGLLSRGKTFDEATQEVVLMLEPFVPDVREAVIKIIGSRRDEITRREKLREADGNTSTSRDVLELGWYTGPKENGVWSSLRDRMQQTGLGDAIDEIDKSTDAIVSSLAEPRVYDAKRLGLVVGNVQSGKTANFSAVIAKGIDEKYRFVIVLSGIHNNLRKQTQERLERDLGMDGGSQGWYRLTDPEGDFGRTHIRNAGVVVSTHEKIIAVVKKNGSRLQNVLDFLRSVDEKTRKNTPILIVDDESDQATPDSSAKPENDPTKINKLMREIWAEVRNGTYVGYTATPFANILMDPNSNTRGNGLQQLYPKDFVHVMRTPKAYFGAERIFGLESSPDANIPDVIRAIPKDELEFLTPAKGGSPSVTESLEDAIRWFVVSAAIRRTRGQVKKHSTMLIHTTHRVNPHFAMRDEVKAFLAPLQRAAREEEVDSFLDTFHNERDRAAELYTGEMDAPSWQLVKAEIPNVLRAIKVSVDNGSASDAERLNYPDDNPQTVIVIGGGTLSRGLTLEGLFVSYFTRTSSTYDTLLQMGRWFGYRLGYEDLQRVWLSPGLEDDYRFLATVEEDVRQEIRRMAGSNETPEQIGVRVLLHPGRLQVTSAAKMKHATVAEVDFEGTRLQTTLFDVTNVNVHNENVNVALQLRQALAPYRKTTGSILYADVPVNELEVFFNDFVVHSRFEENFKNAYSWATENMPQKTWNVVIPDGNELKPFDLIQRTPIGEKNAADLSHINIRSLMSGGDILRDFEEYFGKKHDLGSSPKHNEQLDLRRDRDGLDGRGLLILYPISRTSKVQGERKHRRDMDDVLQEIAPELLEDPDLPIMGVAYIAPLDSRKELEVRRGTRIRVVPEFSESHDEIDDILDNEGSYAG